MVRIVLESLSSEAGSLKNDLKRSSKLEPIRAIQSVIQTFFTWFANEID
jgi:hypothetical protein